MIFDGRVAHAQLVSFTDPSWKVSFVPDTNIVFLVSSCTNYERSISMGMRSENCANCFPALDNCIQITHKIAPAGEGLMINRDLLMVKKNL